LGWFGGRITPGRCGVRRTRRAGCFGNRSRSLTFLNQSLCPVGGSRELANQVCVEAHVLDVVSLYLGIGADQFFEPLHVLGSEGLLARGVEKNPQLGENR